METTSISIAKTNKLYCSECGRKIKKGETIVFYLTKIGKKFKMNSCICCNCGDEIIKSDEDEKILDDIFYNEF